MRYPILVCAAFASTIGLYYDSSGWLDCVGYFVVSVAGMSLGNVRYRKRVY
jgi:hypothetical protein